MPVSDFPSIEPNNVEINSVVPVQSHTTLSGREIRIASSGPYYRCTYRFSPLTTAQRKTIQGHYALAKGQTQSFYVKLPTGLDDTTGAAAGTISIVSNLSAGATSADYTKVSGTSETVFKAGDYIQFTNHGKIYCVTEDSNSTGGAGTVNFYPPLRTATPNTETINYQNLEILVRYENDLNYVVNANSFGDFEITFKEVFE